MVLLRNLVFKRAYGLLIEALWVVVKIKVPCSVPEIIGAILY